MTSKPARVAISAVLLVVAVTGIVVQILNARRGLDIGVQGHLTIAGYVLVALYALLTIVAQLRSTRGPS